MLLSKELKVNGRAVTVSLSEEMWDVCEKICKREKIKIADLCSLVDKRRGKTRLSPALCFVVLDYAIRSSGTSGSPILKHLSAV